MNTNGKKKKKEKKKETKETKKRKEKGNTSATWDTPICIYLNKCP